MDLRMSRTGRGDRGGSRGGRGGGRGRGGGGRGSYRSAPPRDHRDTQPAKNQRKELVDPEDEWERAAMGAFEASRPSGTEAAAVARRYRRAGAADFDPSPAPPSDPPTTQIPIVEAPEDKQRARFGSDNDEDSEAALIDPAAPDSSVDESDAFDSADEAEFGHLFGGKNRRYNNSGKRGKERAARGVEGRAAGNANDGDGDDDEDDDGRPTRRASSGSASASQDVGTEEEGGGRRILYKRTKMEADLKMSSCCWGTCLNIVYLLSACL